MWHLDGYDKITPFGLCIHGGMDGFSRKVLWCKVGYTNRDPKIIAGYFMKDSWTGNNSFLYGKSIGNQSLRGGRETGSSSALTSGLDFFTNGGIMDNLMVISLTRARSSLVFLDMVQVGLHY